MPPLSASQVFTLVEIILMSLMLYVDYFRNRYSIGIPKSHNTLMYIEFHRIRAQYREIADMKNPRL